MLILSEQLCEQLFEKKSDHHPALPMHQRQNAQKVLAELNLVFICIEWRPPLSQSG